MRDARWIKLGLQRIISHFKKFVAASEQPAIVATAVVNGQASATSLFAERPI
jgi:hypothetical protein